MTVKQRQSIECKIARAILNTTEKQGYTFVIDNGGDGGEEVKCSTAAQAIKEMFATDEERVYFMKDGKCCGWVYFVYGNDGWDVVNDYTTNLALIIEPITDKYQDMA